MKHTAPTAIRQMHQSLLVGYSDGAVCLVDPRAQKGCLTLIAEGEPSSSVNYLDARDNLVLASFGNALVVHDVRVSKQLVRISGPCQKAIFAGNPHNVCFFGCGQSELQVFNIKENAVSFKRRTKFPVEDITFAESSSELVLLSADRHVDECGLSSAETCVQVFDHSQQRARLLDCIMLGNQPIEAMALDSSDSYLYLFGEEVVKLWKFYLKEEHQKIKSNMQSLFDS